MTCDNCMRCHRCADLMSRELHSMLVCWRPEMGPDYAKLRQELDELEEYLEEWDIQDQERMEDLDDPYAQRGVSRSDFY